jgi:hypothetical protein
MSLLSGPRSKEEYEAMLADIAESDADEEEEEETNDKE